MVPVVPAVVVFDGVVSSLRTRREGELLGLVRGGGGGERGERGGEREERNGDGEVRKRKRQEIANEDEDKDETETEPAKNPNPNPINNKSNVNSKWRFSSGTETHTWLLGELNWFVAVKS